MKKYELRKAACEVKKSEIKKGCTLYAVESKLIQSFDDKRKALEMLKAYKPRIDRFSTPIGQLYAVEEYRIEEAEYDSEGEWIGGGDIWDFSELPDEMI